ncbi:hypothetical protein BJ170DRAFT_222351 [Xylariales sp. AK1849]|nr:hypothetical protein BJ170DRAFT_222351 [Xylariales sp. AK1849]
MAFSSDSPLCGFHQEYSSGTSDSMEPRTSMITFSDEVRGEESVTSQPMSVEYVEQAGRRGNEKPCQYLKQVVDECHMSRFFARAVDHYLLDPNTQSSSSYPCLLSGCPCRFPDAKEMLRHLKGCALISRGRFDCPTCGEVETFRTVSKKKCAWDRNGFGKKLQRGLHASLDLITRRFRSKQTHCPRCHYILQEEPRSIPRGGSSNITLQSEKLDLTTDATINPNDLGIYMKQMPSAVPYGVYELDPTYIVEVDALSLPSELCGSHSLSSDHNFGLYVSKQAQPLNDYQVSQPTVASSISTDQNPSSSSPTQVSPASNKDIVHNPTEISPVSSYRSSNRGSNGKITPQLFPRGRHHQVDDTQHQSLYGTHRKILPRLRHTQSTHYGPSQSMLHPDTFGASVFSTDMNPTGHLLDQTGSREVGPSLPLTIKTNFADPETATWGPDSIHSRIPDIDATPIACSFAGYSAQTPNLVPFATTAFNQSLTSPPTISPTDSHMRDVDTLAHCLSCPDPDCDFEPTGKEKNLQGYLRKHIKIHDENAKVKCPICDKPFTRQDNLTVHIRTVHEGSSLKKKRCL